MRKRPTITVQPLYYTDANGHQSTNSILRLRGVWLAEIFPPQTRVRVTREERHGKIVLVLETIDPIESAGGETLKRD